MAHQSAATNADPKEVERAHDMWGNFTGLVKWSTIAIIAILILMATFLL